MVEKLSDKEKDEHIFVLERRLSWISVQYSTLDDEVKGLRREIDQLKNWLIELERAKIGAN